MKLKFAAAVVALAFSASASATVVYSNGTLNGTSNANTINNGFSVSDSFTLSQAANLTGATAGLWTLGGTTASSLTWSIGSSAFATDLGTGVASLSNVYSNGAFGYDVNLSSFLLNSNLGAGTYWFSLSNAVSGNSSVYWDMNGGPSTGMQRANNGTPYGVTSHYFTLSADAAQVPEPGSLALLGLGLVGFAAARRRKAANQA
jgi:hypothetical protein